MGARRVGLVPALSLAFAFGAGIAVSPLAQHLLPSAQAQAAGLKPMIVDIAAIKEADLPTTPNPDLRAKGLVATEQATIGVQMGNVGKHFHTDANEVQYIVEGTGTAWLGDNKVEIRPGMLIIIPKGTNHAGTESTSGRFKALAIKIPPQAPTDTTFVK
jgi:mannose-6-phosphate isomerase-like protein (cupin superfamily)